MKHGVKFIERDKNELCNWWIVSPQQWQDILSISRPSTRPTLTNKASIPRRDTTERSEENILSKTNKPAPQVHQFQYVSNPSTTTSSGGCDFAFEDMFKEQLQYLVPLPKVAPPQVLRDGQMAKPCNSQKDVNMMTLTGDDSSLKTNQICVLTNALDKEVREKAATFREEFNLNAPDSPRTPGEFKQSIADGKFVFIWNGEPMKDDERMPYVYSEYLVFRDPDKIPNKEGYDTAICNLRKTKEDYAVKVSVLQNPEDGLKLLEDFKALPTSTFH